MRGKIRVSFVGSISRFEYYNRDTGYRELVLVNCMIAHCAGGSLYDEDELYAEVVLPDYGYDELKQEIIHQCIEKVITLICWNSIERNV